MNIGHLQQFIDARNSLIAERDRIKQRLTEIDAVLGGTRKVGRPRKAAAKRSMSQATRSKIAAAARKRWAKAKK